MTRAVLPIVLLTAFCAIPRSGTTHTSSLPGHAAIAISILPNPIVASHVSGNTYDFPFDVVVREIAGRSVTISLVTADVYASGGVHIATESWDAGRITAAGFATGIPAKDQLRYHFAPRKSVPNEEIFGGVYAEVRVDAADDTGTAASATVTVTVTK